MTPLRLACSNGHAITLPAGSPEPTACPACIYGTPCTGTLRRIGQGARRANDAKRAAAKAEGR